MNIASRGATMALDWEQRADFDRLGTYRLARAKAPLEASTRLYGEWIPKACEAK